MNENSALPTPTLRKVGACIIRRSQDGLYSLLLFHHADMPEVPAQIPGGGIDRGESPQDALSREILEESGLTNARMLRSLGITRWFWEDAQSIVERHVFLLEVPPETPDEWIHTVTGQGGDCELRFAYSWTRRPEDFKLGGGIDELITAGHIPEIFESPRPGD